MPLRLVTVRDNKATIPVSSTPREEHALHHDWDESRRGWNCTGHCWRDWNGSPLPMSTQALTSLGDADAMRAQFHAMGFVVLRDLVSKDSVDALAMRVSQTIATRGRIVQPINMPHADPGGERFISSGYLLENVMNDSSLARLTHEVHGSERLHRALERIYAPGDDFSLCGGNSSGRYRFIHRNDVVVDYSTPWHVDAGGLREGVWTRGVNLWSAASDGQKYGLLVAGLYLQDQLIEPGLEVFAGSHTRSQPYGGAQVAETAAARLQLFMRRGDVVLFNYVTQHRSGNTQLARRHVEPTTPVSHRAMFNVGYGCGNALAEAIAYQIRLDQKINAQPATYGCPPARADPRGKQCRKAVHLREYTRLHGEPSATMPAAFVRNHFSQKAS